MSNRVKSVEQHYSVAEAAALVSASKNTIRNRIADGSISPVRQPSPAILRIPASSLHRWMCSRPTPLSGGGGLDDPGDDGVRSTSRHR